MGFEFEEDASESEVEGEVEGERVEEGLRADAERSLGSGVPVGRFSSLLSRSVSSSEAESARFMAGKSEASASEAEAKAEDEEDEELL